MIYINCDIIQGTTVSCFGSSMKIWVSFLLQIMVKYQIEGAFHGKMVSNVHIFHYVIPTHSYDVIADMIIY